MPLVDFPGRIGKTVAESAPWWPPRSGAGLRRPNVLVVLFDDVGFADLGCYGSSIPTPAIDALAARGVRLTGFHTTAMCSTTRAALLTGCNHHRVGMGCLANFDGGFPGYRGKIAPEAATLPEMLRPHGYVNYMVGKWHVTPLNETGPTGPFDGWPLGRGYDRFYGFMDAETDQYAPELVRDNTTRSRRQAASRAATTSAPTWSTRASATWPTTRPTGPTARGTCGWPWAPAMRRTRRPMH